MFRIKRENCIYSFDKNDKPALRVEAGETVIFETQDCYNGNVDIDGTVKEYDSDKYGNPATGPLYINGASKGDVLKIEILDIKTDKYGIMIARKNKGGLREFIKEERIKVIPIKDDIAVLDDNVMLTIKPMIGVIGLAPLDEPVKTVVPGNFGGNLDCKYITKDAVVYLPVSVEGALLSLGDLHASMGDGEVMLCGLETKGEVTIKVEVLKDRIYTNPIVISEDKLMILASAETLDEAALAACSAMQSFLVSTANMDNYDAARLLSLAGDLKICQIVNPLKTCRMELPLDILSQYNFSINYI